MNLASETDEGPSSQEVRRNPLKEKLSVCLDTVFIDPITKEYQPKANDIESHLDVIQSVGLRAFEFWDWKDKGDIGRISELARNRGLQVSLMAGQRKHSLLRGEFKYVQRELEASISQAKKLGCDHLSIMVDEPDANWHFRRRSPRGLRESDKYRNVIDGLSRMARIAEREEVTLCLEHFNTVVDHPGYWLDSVEDGLAIVKRIGSDHLKLLLDIYHMGIMEGNLIEKIRPNIEFIGHVHIASIPGRNEPYEGELSYWSIFRHQMWQDYRGFFGLEYYPTEGANDPAARAKESLTRTIEYFERPGEVMSSHLEGHADVSAAAPTEAASARLLLDAVLTEYSALRNEIDTAGGNLYAASWQGALALGATFVAGATVLEDSKVVATIIFGAGGAGIASYFIVLWAEEVFRVIRVGEYVRNFIEPKIQKLAGTVLDFEPNVNWPGREEDSSLEWGAPLAFECYLRSRLHKHQFPWFQRTHYRITHLPFYLVGLAAVAISGYLISQEDWSEWFLALPGAGAIILTGVWGWYVGQVRKMMGTHY